MAETDGSIVVTADTSQFRSELDKAAKSTTNMAVMAEQTRQRIIAAHR